MAFAFRVRFVMGRSCMINSPDPHLPIPDPISGKDIVLKASGPLNEARSVALLGRPYGSNEEALAAAERWAGVLQKSFAHLNIGADFGERAAQGSFTNYGLEMLAGKSGARVQNDVHGVSVFEYPPDPHFAAIGPVTGVVGSNLDRLTTTIDRALKTGAVMSDSEQLSYDLYAASFSEASPDARFVLLMMAVEALIDPAPRSDEVRTHVNDLIEATRNSGLPQAEVKSILGSLGWLRDESINQAGRRLSSQLGDRLYMDDTESAEQFFSKCYQLRSHLVHGGFPRPSREEVASRGTSLKRFVADLLSPEL